MWRCRTIADPSGPLSEIWSCISPEAQPAAAFTSHVAWIERTPSSSSYPLGPRIWRRRDPISACLGTRGTIRTCTAGRAQAAEAEPLTGGQASGGVHFCDSCFKTPAAVCRGPSQVSRLEQTSLSRQLCACRTIRKSPVCTEPVPILRRLFPAQTACPE